jgi:hypothetical protein
VLAWDASQLPERVLQAFGDGGKALASENHPHMLPAAAGQPEMVQAMRERLAGDGDAEAVGDGEIGQRLAARIMALGEVNLLILAVQGAPSCDATLEGSADAVWKNFRADFILEVLEDRHRHHAGDLQHLQNPGPDIRQRVGAGSPCSRLPFLRGQTRVFIDAARGARAEAGHGRGGFLVVLLGTGHVEHHLAVGHMKVRHRGSYGWLNEPRYHPRRRTAGVPSRGF